MRSAPNVNPQEGDASMSKYLLDWSKDLVVPETDLTLKKFSMVFSCSTRKPYMVHRAMFAICRAMYQLKTPPRALKAHHHNSAYPKISSTNFCNRIVCLA